MAKIRSVVPRNMPDLTKPEPEKCLGLCGKCGAFAARRDGKIYPHPTPETADRPKKRICFGL